jgi:hypothetical protein
MKNTKKLTILGLSAATALVAATGAVSSFAWFATNSQVTATGMVIKAESTNAFLEIKNAKASWDNEHNNVTANVTGVKTIKPTSLASEISSNKETITAYADDGKAHKWVSATASSVDVGTATSVFEDVTEVAETTDTTNLYTLISDFDLRLRYTAGMTKDNYNLSAKVDWTTSSTTTTKGALADSVKVFMVIGDVGKETLPESFASASGKVFSARNGAWKTGKVLSNTFAANEEQKGTRVRVFAYFDGQDEACTTVNAVADSSYSFTITFSVSK